MSEQANVGFKVAPYLKLKFDRVRVRIGMALITDTTRTRF
jgi:hypothetical protein